MDRVLVTGGAGFIGSHLVDHLLSAYEVVVLDDLSTGFEKNLIGHSGDSHLTFIRGTILSEADVNRALEGVTTVYHFAAQPDVRLSMDRPLWDFKVNMYGGMVLLDRIREAGIRRVVFASSGGTVYGETNLFPTPEAVAFRPISNYGAAKGAFEMYLSSYAELYGIDSVAMRFGNVIGPRSTHGVIYDFYMKLKNNPTKLEVLGTGDQKKAYLHVLDAVEAASMLAKSMPKGFTPVNISSGERMKVSQIARIAVEELSPSAKIEYTGSERGWAGDVLFTDIDISLLKSFGWEPSMSLERALRLCFKWLTEEFGLIASSRDTQKR